MWMYTCYRQQRNNYVTSLINRTQPGIMVGVSTFFSKILPLPYATIWRDATNVFKSVKGQQKNCLKQSGLYKEYELLPEAHASLSVVLNCHASLSVVLNCSFCHPVYRLQPPPPPEPDLLDDFLDTWGLANPGSSRPWVKPWVTSR